MESFEKDKHQEVFPSDASLNVALDVPWSRIQQLLQESASVLHSTPSTSYSTPNISLDDVQSGFCSNCEGKIQQLQKKFTDANQQLAVAISSNYTKNVMIEQLDKTLSKIVEGWKKVESEKAAQIRKLELERNASKEALTHEQELLMKVEQDLTLTLKKLVLSEKEIQQVYSDKDTWVAECKNKLDTLYEELKVERMKVANFMKTNETATEEYEKKLRENNTRIAVERQEWQLREEKLTSQIKDLETQIVNIKGGQLQSEQFTKTSQIQVQLLSSQLDDVLREKESLKVEISILQARNTAERSEIEVKMKAAMEVQKREHENEMQSLETRLVTEHEMKIKENECRHRKLLDEFLRVKAEESAKERAVWEIEKDKAFKVLSEQHAEQLKLQAAEWEVQKSNENDKVKEVMTEFAQLQKENAVLASSRSQLMSRIQDLLQNQWEESLRILYGNADKPPMKLNLTSVPRYNSLYDQTLDFYPSCDAPSVSRNFIPDRASFERIHTCKPSQRPLSASSTLQSSYRQSMSSTEPMHNGTSQHPYLANYQNLPNKPIVERLTVSHSWPSCTNADNGFYPKCQQRLSSDSLSSVPPRLCAAVSPVSAEKSQCDYSLNTQDSTQEEDSSVLLLTDEQSALYDKFLKTGQLEVPIGASHSSAELSIGLKNVKSSSVERESPKISRQSFSPVPCLDEESNLNSYWQHPVQKSISDKYLKQQTVRNSSPPVLSELNNVQSLSHGSKESSTRSVSEDEMSFKMKYSKMGSKLHADSDSEIRQQREASSGNPVKLRFNLPTELQSKDLNETMARHEERQLTLKKYLEKLLRRPPGEPCDSPDLWPSKETINSNNEEDDDDDDDEADKYPEKDESVEKRAEKTCRQWVANNSKTKHLSRLPLHKRTKF